jgi:hypothetical protein
MKKIVILLFAVITAISCSKDDEQTPTPEPVANTALKVFNKTTGAEIKDGDVLTVNSISSQGGANELKFYFKNTSSAPINTKVKFISFSGVPDTSYLSICIGAQCLSSIITGYSYPLSSEPIITIPANGIVGDVEGYKIFNTTTPVSPATKIDYVFEAYQYDANGTPVGNKVRFTYRYQQ